MAGKKKKSSNKWKRSLFQSPIPEGRPVWEEELEETVHNQEPPSTPETHPIQQVIVQEEAQSTVQLALDDEADEDLSSALSSNMTAMKKQVTKMCKFLTHSDCHVSYITQEITRLSLS